MVNTPLTVLASLNVLLLATNWRAPPKFMLRCPRWRNSDEGRKERRAPAGQATPNSATRRVGLFLYTTSTHVPEFLQFFPSLLRILPLSFLFLGNLPSSLGGLDHWLCLARPRLNTCIHACKLFSKDGGVALKFSGSCSSADIPALSSPRLGRAVLRTSGEFIFFPTLNRR